MSSPVEDLVEKLRAATEDDVEAALGELDGVALESVAPDCLLEFFNRMLDVLVGADES